MDPGHVTRSYFYINKNDGRSYFLHVQNFTFPLYLGHCNLDVSVNYEHEHRSWHAYCCEIHDYILLTGQKVSFLYIFKCIYKSKLDIL